MEEKRASLAEKLDTLENHVLGTVHEATAAVAHTVEDVKSVVDTVTENVKDTVETVTETVKHTFDIRDHVRRHPWGMFCGAIAVGFVGGRLLPASRSSEAETPSPAPPPRPFVPPPRAAAPRQEEDRSGMGEMLKRVRGLALGAVMKMVRDLLSESLPEAMRGDVMSLVDDFTTRLGGKPVPETSPPAGSNGAHASASQGEQSHEEQLQARAEEPQAASGEQSQRPQGNRKGQQPSGGRFDRRNPPPRR